MFRGCMISFDGLYQNNVNIKITMMATPNTAQILHPNRDLSFKISLMTSLVFFNASIPESKYCSSP